MGEIRVIDGLLHHRTNTTEPAVWERIGYDADGAAITGIWHGEAPRVLLDEESGHIVMSIGGTFFSFPAEVGAGLYDAMEPLIPKAKAVKVDELLAFEEARLAKERERLEAAHSAAVQAMAGQTDAGAAIDAALAAKRAELDAAQQLLERKQAEVEALDAQLRGG